MNFTLHLGDSLAVLKTLPDSSVDAVVTDPPYGLAFMGKKWDYDVPGEELWRACLRVLKPGGHLLAFAGTRTQHRMAVRIEDAGFEIRDMVAWVYGSGFPKSLDVSKAIDKMAGAEREVVSIGNPVKRMIPGSDQNATGSWIKNNGREYQPNVSAPATPAAKEWQGWGTALKPSFEPITMARKPLGEGTVAANVLAWGVGGINVDGCRVEGNGEVIVITGMPKQDYGGQNARPWHNSPPPAIPNPRTGRWPANLVHDGSEEVVGLFPVTTSGKPSGMRRAAHTFGCGREQGTPLTGIGDTGSAARFFYCAKASRSEREAGCEGLEERIVQSGCGGAMPIDDDGRERDRFKVKAANVHPTVKPIALMRWLCRLVTPPGGLVLDPFMGSGTTGCAAMLEGFNFVGIEREPEYIEIARRRIAYWAEQAEAEREADEEDRQLSLIAV